MAGIECSYLSLVCFILLLFLNLQPSVRCPYMTFFFFIPQTLDDVLLPVTMDTEVLPAVCLEITGGAIPEKHYSQV